MDPICVLVCDDDAAVRAALVDVLDADDRFLVVAVSSDGHAGAEVAARQATENGCGLALVDVGMPGGGAELTRTLRALPSRPVVVACSAHAEPWVVADLLRAGATGYLAKGRIGADLPDLLARCATGEVVLAVPAAREALRILAAG
jgi:two-component system nitrate/nitrite response regulator NarL